MAMDILQAVKMTYNGAGSINFATGTLKKATGTIEGADFTIFGYDKSYGEKYEREELTKRAGEAGQPLLFSNEEHFNFYLLDSRNAKGFIGGVPYAIGIQPTAEHEEEELLKELILEIIKHGTEEPEPASGIDFSKFRNCEPVEGLKGKLFNYLEENATWSQDPNEDRKDVTLKSGEQVYLTYKDENTTEEAEADLLRSYEIKENSDQYEVDAIQFPTGEGFNFFWHVRPYKPKAKFIEIQAGQYFIGIEMTPAPGKHREQTLLEILEVITKPKKKATRKRKAPVKPKKDK